MYTFDESILSDLHKDARGWRPREDFWGMWNKADDARKQKIWDGLAVELEYRWQEEQRKEAEDVAEFENELTEIMKVGRGCDRETALRWMTPVEEFQHSQDVEHWVWERGILFTALGRWAVEELKKDLKPMTQED